MSKIFNLDNQEFVEIECTDENVGLNLNGNFNFMNFSISTYQALQDLFNTSAWLYRNRIYMNNPISSGNASGTLNIGTPLDFTVEENMDSNKILLYKYSLNGHLDYGKTQKITATYDFSYRDLQFIETRLIPVVITHNTIIIASGILYIAFMQFPTYMAYQPFSFEPSHIFNGVAYNVDYHDTTITNDSLSYRELDITDNTEQGGGYGIGSMPTDNINIPNLPVINMSDTGATLYSLTPLKMKQFRSWLWTTDWVKNLKKIRTDPMQNIIGISLIDVPIPQGLNGLIYVGNVSSTVEANVISNSFIELDCGEITLTEYYGSFADYEPFIATTLYLPKVGFVQIPADVCVNNTIKVVYHIELSSGEGLCYVQLTSKRDGFTYIWNTYTCHITSNISLSAQDHSQQLVALGNAIINTSLSASNAIINPTSVGQGLSNTLSSCIDVAATKNPTSTKGNVGNMSAIMCYKKPYLLINRTNLTKPSTFQENNGYLINYSSKISNHTGFLKTKDFHAEFNAPYNHKVEIERLMNEGVFING